MADLKMESPLVKQKATEVMNDATSSSAPLLDLPTAAKYLGIGAASLRTHLKQGTGPKYIPLGPNGGKLRFRQYALDDWLRDREVSGRPEKR